MVDTPNLLSLACEKQDADRRDITINAVYWNPISRELYDPHNGEKDLYEKLIRIIGNPGIRIKHDALRLLRVVRFRAAIDGQYHPETYSALREHAAMIEVLSGTRRLDELEKMLLCPHPDRALEDLWETGILQYMIPELFACKGIPQPADYHHEGDVWDHTLACTRACTEEHSIDVRLAALFHDCGKVKTFSLTDHIHFNEHASVSGDIAKDVLDRLQCPGKRRDKIVWLVKHHMMMGTFLQTDLSDDRKAHWYYDPWFRELLHLFWIDIAGTDPADFSLYEAILDDYHHFLDAHPLPPKTLLTGEDVMEILDIGPGERIGEILRELYGKQIRQEITSKEEARGWLKGTETDN